MPGMANGGVDLIRGAGRRVAKGPVYLVQLPPLYGTGHFLLKSRLLRRRLGQPLAYAWYFVWFMEVLVVSERCVCVCGRWKPSQQTDIVHIQARVCLARLSTHTPHAATTRLGQGRPIFFSFFFSQSDALPSTAGRVHP